MHVDIRLQLPRDAESVPFVRHLCAHTLREMQVEEDCRHDVEIAVTEACTNVIDHAGPTDDYRASVRIGDGWCVIRVIDAGRGHDFSDAGPGTVAEDDDEHGRGVALMHALVDKVQFESRAEEGTVVHLEKALAYVGASPSRPT